LEVIACLCGPHAGEVTKLTFFPFTGHAEISGGAAITIVTLRSKAHAQRRVRLLTTADILSWGTDI